MTVQERPNRIEEGSYLPSLRGALATKQSRARPVIARSVSDEAIQTQKNRFDYHLVAPCKNLRNERDAGWVDIVIRKKKE
ncbi:MAG: hypothetical protein A2103_01770 [Gammaproteobacteria bacterium GWF2_41_13]|nr:MAG: hypothetical protein A2103_01770 [Gammaproteobacteria bacterium GWF2_41_13]